ncbi:MAG: polysaccharide biosynthesis C-terminal domain-containing protein, partial [Bacteroidales bacterium]|nr:polysaccharide biosynthesis C-terminal domain-containing protein [Bacteroidales bacterium]
QAFRYAYEPFVFGGERDKNSKENQALVMKYFVMFTLLAFLAVMFYIDVLKYIIKRDYWEGLRAVPIVMMAEIFMGIYFNLSFWYKLTDRTWWGAIISGIGCVVLLAVNIIFVPQIGYMACAWGGFAGYGVCVLLSYFLGQKNYKVPYDVLGIAGYFAIALGLYFISTLFHFERTILTLAANTALLLVYVAIIMYNERVFVKSAVQAIRKKIFKRD